MHGLFSRFLVALWLLLGMIVSANAYASSSGAILPAAIHGPTRIDLSGEWDFHFDPQGEGERDQWFSTNKSLSWQKVKVPGSFNEELAAHPLAPDPKDTYRFYEGKVWYRTSFHAPKDPGTDFFLHFSGTVLRQKVWLNGKLIGASSLPWLDVVYDISTTLLRGKENTLVIEVDNSIQPDAIPDAKWRGWWDDGGLIWPVYLEERQRVRSNSFATTTLQADGSWKLAIQTEVHRDVPAETQLAIALTDTSGNIVWQNRQMVSAAGRDVEVQAAAVLKQIHSWSPDHPTLYRLTVTTNAGRQNPDITSFHIGFRQITTRGSQLLLNGEPLTLRGINRHEFFPGVGQSVPVAQNRKDMEDIKALGANFVRLAHYSQSQDIYDECDELGLLVWTEIPAWQSAVSTLASPEVWKNSVAPQLEAMVKQHRNHPSVIIWSVANEVPSDKPEVKEYIAKAVEFVHHFDSTRLVTFASDRRERDISMGPVDIIAVNEYYGWYYGNLDDVGPMLDRMHAKYPDKPILVSEFGSEAVARWNRDSAKEGSKDYSYDYQMKLLSSHLSQIYAAERRSYIAGGVIWVYSDFPDPHRVSGDHPEIARYRNNKGLVTMDRIHKPSYRLVQEFYTGLLHQQEAEAREH